MAGFLLVEDAVRARKLQFDDWIDEQQRNAAAAAARVAEQAQAAQQAAAQELQARAPAPPPVAAPLPPPQPVYATPEPAYVQAPTLAPEVQDRARVFDGWVAQQQALQEALANATPPGRDLGLLSQLGQGVEAASREATRQQSEGFLSQLPVEAARATAGQFGQPLPPELETGLRQASPIVRGFESDPGGVASAFLKSSGIAPPEATVPLPVAGDVPVADVVGLGANLMLPTGGGARSAARTTLAREVADLVSAEGPDALRNVLQQALRSSSRAGPGVAEDVAGGAFGGGLPAQASAMAAARLGGGVAGGVTGYATTPEEAGPVERIGRTLGGVGVGLAAPSIAEAALTRPQIQQDILESLRRGGVVGGPAMSNARTNLTGEVVDITKQMMLSNPEGRAMDVVGNTIELLRQPAALTMGGRGPEAAAGLAALGRAIPEAARNTADVLFRGQQAATLGAGAAQTRGRDLIFRILGAGDMFTRTLGEYQGMASKGVQMLNDAGIPLGTPQAEQYLAQHADELYRAGAQSGTTSVFGSAQGGQHASAIDQLMKRFGDFKESKINSSNPLDQAVGALLDLEVPFTGVPSRVWQIAIQRVPGITQTVGVARIARALDKRDTFAASKALGELTMESMIQAQIAQGIRDGFITGPDDPEHPNSVQVNGAWLPLARMGVYGTPMAIMATFAESWQKTGREIDPETTDRFGAALNASMEPLMEALPGFTLMQTLAGLGRGGGTRAITDTASDAVTRLLSPAFGAQVEHMVDPVVRDIATRGPHQLWEPAFAKNPLLARFLPPKIDPTTGEPMARGYSVVGGMTKPSSPVRAELARLKRMGYQLNPPDDRPSSITVRGVQVPVKNGTPEQRAMVEARGRELAKLGERMQQPSYATMSDDQKAKMWASMLDRSARVQQRAWLENVDPEVGARLLASGKRVVGRVRDVEDETEQINRRVALENMLRRQRRDREREYEQRMQTATPRNPFAIG